MPEDYSRTEVHFPPELARKLERLRLEAEQSTGQRVTKSELLVKIVENFFTRMRHTSSREMDLHLEEEVVKKTSL